jgi:predicted transcriptional regulator of viral defense system
MRSRRAQITEIEGSILKHIENNEFYLFWFSDILKSGGFDGDELQDALSRLTKSNHLFRIEKGLYCVRNFKNTHLIANLLLKDSAIAYWTALNIHGLTEQIPNVVYSQSSHLKPDKIVFNVRYKFVKVKPEKMFGSMQMGYGNEAFKITDIEKTLLDCFDLPQYAGGYEELIRAFYEAKYSSIRLLSYGRQIGNLSVLKRMAFLSELFEMKGFTRFKQGVLSMMNKKYTLIDPFGENTGKFNAKWRIRLNIPSEDLLKMINKIY